LLRCRQLEEAESFIEKAMALKPDLAEAWQVRGEILGHQQKFTEAVAAFTHAAELAPRYARPHHGAGVVLALQGDFAAAAAAMERALKLDPNYPEANCGAGAILLRVGQASDAIPFYEKALAIDPGYLEARADLALAYEKADRLKDAAGQYEVLAGATVNDAFFRFQRASVGGGETPPAAPSELVARMFDKYARVFDEHLTKYLGYRAPQLIFQAVARAGPAHELDILDLGCGTGLCGQLFKPMAAKLIGVDLSPAMVQKARERDIYDRLVVADLLEITATLSERFDLVTASDVFCYLGDLSPIFQKVADLLRPRAFFAFTVEAIGDGESGDAGYLLRRTRRYAHSASYVQQLACRHRYELLSLDRTALRTENHQDVEGLIVVLRHP
jgi:predicted TPR repeat methyltransferase